MLLFHSDAAVPQPRGVRRDELFSDDDWSDMSVSGHVDVPVLAFKTDVI